MTLSCADPWSRSATWTGNADPCVGNRQSSRSSSACDHPYPPLTHTHLAIRRRGQLIPKLLLLAAKLVKLIIGLLALNVLHTLALVEAATIPCPLLKVPKLRRIAHVTSLTPRPVHIAAPEAKAQRTHSLAALPVVGAEQPVGLLRRSLANLHPKLPFLLRTAAT
ncbi:hypothetical protein E2C01_028253 [Portunus trituberculatus]|uniref:Uncharacterized protein n=1 Tax=Portunus trituberculatus TaxID=210409 RepID=A0A5B7EJZ8_PORTR|nr:hypothetical protein [Portunus trituberculatus]